MKKIFKSLILVAAAAMGFTACQEELQGEDYANEGTVVVSFVAGTPDTKTSVDTSGDTPLFAWDDDEEFAVLEQRNSSTPTKAGSVEYEKVDGKAKITATFGAGYYVKGATIYQYVTIYPASGYVGAESLANATLSLPAEQTMASGSYDPAADLMVSTTLKTTNPPTEVQQVEFTRLAAVAKMTLNGLGAGEQVEKVIFTAEGKNLAGTVTANLADPHKFTVAEGEGVDNVSVAATSNEVLFTVLPTTLDDGDAYTVTVITDKYLYVKNGVIPEEKSLVFEAGMVTRFNVDMSGVDPSEKWVLVRDASTLSEGDIVTIAASDLNYVMGCYFSSNFPYASYTTNVIKYGDYLYHPIVTDKSKYQYMAQSLILAKRDAGKVAFDFYNGEDYEGDAKSGYLTNAQTNNYLQLSQYPTKNTLFYVTVDGESGVATISATDSEYNNKLLKYRAYNGGTQETYRRFGFVNEATAEHHDVCIYKLTGKTGVVPTADAVITVPEEDEPVVIPVEGVVEAKVFEDVKFTYVGDWTITAATDDPGNWLTLNYADGVLKYSAGANPGAVRYATVTITATHENEADKTWSFKVVQKGAPTKVTVAEFLAVATKDNIDPNVEYEVTGILSYKPTSSSGNAKIKDINGNEATFAYVYMPNNTTSLSANNEIQLNDVVTIVAAVSGAKTGGSSSAHAICKGYYNFSAAAEKDLVGYEGGNVKLSLTKRGTLEPAGDISCSVNGSGAEVAYTTNAMEATLTFEANDGAPRQAVVTFTDTYASASVTVVQSADPAKGNTWELVTDASTLAADDQVIIAAKDYDVAMSTTISSERRSAVAVTKLGNHYLTPAATAQTFVLGKGSVDGTFAFYDAVNKGFLVSSSKSYELNNQAYIDANASFTIAIADGVATIGNKEGDYNENKLYYREGSSYNYFYSGETEKQAVCLYRLVGGKGTIPVIPADVTVPESSKKVVVPEEGAAEATPINDVVFNYVGDWTITAAAEADWITFEFDKVNNKLTYKANKNEGIVRETTATITASMDGQESNTWTFNILQKGAPMEVSIAEFITKGQNVNITYKLTGVVASVAESYAKAYVIEDGAGNKANIKYLKVEGGDYVVNEDDVEIKVGDVITVTTVVTSSTKGDGGSTTYPSFLKGYYRLTATPSTTLVGYEGGDVTFNLAAEGNLLPDGAVINGALAEGNDFVTFNYTTGASTATATFAVNAGAPRNAKFNFTFGQASASVTVGQKNNPSVKVGWYLVTNISELAIGDKVIIAAKDPDGDKNFAIKKYTSGNASSSSGIAIELLGDSINGVDGVEQFTLESGHTDYDGTWAFKSVTYNNKYLYPNNSNIKISSTLDKGSSWTIEIAPDGKATLVSKTGTSASSKNTMMFTYTASNQNFGLFTSSTTGKGAIYIYKYYNSLAQ